MSKVVWDAVDGLHGHTWVKWATVGAAILAAVALVSAIREGLKDWEYYHEAVPAEILAYYDEVDDVMVDPEVHDGFGVRMSLRYRPKGSDQFVKAMLPTYPERAVELSQRDPLLIFYSTSDPESVRPADGDRGTWVLFLLAGGFGLAAAGLGWVWCRLETGRGR